LFIDRLLEIKLADAALPGAVPGHVLGCAAVVADQRAGARLEPQVGAALVAGKAVFLDRGGGGGLVGHGPTGICAVRAG
jgi:hypothetical protein